MNLGKRSKPAEILDHVDMPCSFVFDRSCKLFERREMYDIHGASDDWKKYLLLI